MKKLTVSCDGTWNTPEQRQFDIPAPTNVVRLHNAIATPRPAGREQRKYYHPGVGTDGSLLDRAKGGAYGRGLGQNVLSAYAWLAHNYEPGDQIYLFGFSRGAFTVRSLGGFIGRCGLLDLAGLAPEEAWRRLDVAYKVYQDAAKYGPQLDPAWAKFPPADGLKTIRIHFIGVWDTVGALGVPDDLALFDFLDDPAKWEFHDTRLGDHVTFARHAVAKRARRSRSMRGSRGTRPAFSSSPAGTASTRPASGSTRTSRAAPAGRATGSSRPASWRTWPGPSGARSRRP